MEYYNIKVYIVYSGVGPEFAFSTREQAEDFVKKSGQIYQIIELRIQ